MAQLQKSVIATGILGGFIGNRRENFNMRDCSSAPHFYSLLNR